MPITKWDFHGQSASFGITSSTMEHLNTIGIKNLDILAKGEIIIDTESVQKDWRKKRETTLWFCKWLLIRLFFHSKNLCFSARKNDEINVRQCLVKVKQLANNFSESGLSFIFKWMQRKKIRIDVHQATCNIQSIRSERKWGPIRVGFQRFVLEHYSWVCCTAHYSNITNRILGLHCFRNLELRKVQY